MLRNYHPRLATNQTDSWMVISCPIVACLIKICIPFFNFGHKEDRMVDLTRVLRQSRF